MPVVFPAYKPIYNNSNSYSINQVQMTNIHKVETKVEDSYLPIIAEIWWKISRSTWIYSATMPPLEYIGNSTTINECKTLQVATTTPETWREHTICTSTRPSRYWNWKRETWRRSWNTALNRFEWTQLCKRMSVSSSDCLLMSIKYNNKTSSAKTIFGRGFLIISEDNALILACRTLNFALRSCLGKLNIQSMYGINWNWQIMIWNIIWIHRSQSSTSSWSRPYPFSMRLRCLLQGTAILIIWPAMLGQVTTVQEVCQSTRGSSLLMLNPVIRTSSWVES